MIWRWVILTVLVAAGSAALAPNRYRTLPRDLMDSPHFTNSWAVQVPGGSKEADAIARKYQLENRGQVGNLKNIFHFVMPKERYNEEHKAKGISNYQPLKSVTEALKQEKSVGLVEQQAGLKMEKKGYSVPTDPRWNEQWSLHNTGQTTAQSQDMDDSGKDVRVEPVWIQGFTGCGSVVGVVDDGVGYTNPDLVSNYDAALQFDYVDDDSDPFPVEEDDNPFRSCVSGHGTCCAGVIAMSKSNDHCGVGVAYHATITGIRLLGDEQTDMQEASSINHKNDIIEIYSNSWGPNDDGSHVEKPGTLMQMALLEGVTNGRDGKGSIFVWSSGNGGHKEDSCAADGYVSSIYTIGIGSADSDGTQAFYDEQCSGKMAVAFVNNPYTNGPLNVVATTADGECTGEFVGTSAACPIASGVMALVLEANPSLTWRDVQYLVVYTSNRDLLVRGEWATNGAGLNVSHMFGFGVIDAEAMVTRAMNWINVPRQQSDTVTSRPPSAEITQGSSPVGFTTSYSGNIHYTEHVVITVSFYFYYFYENYDQPTIDYYNTTGRGDVQIELVSPSGTRSVIFPYRPKDKVLIGLTDFPLMSVHFWGEDPRGDWLMSVNTVVPLNFSLIVHNVTLTVYGTTETPAAVDRIPATCAQACARGCAASGPQYCDACAENYVRNATTLECISECPSGFVVRSGYCYDPASPEPQCNNQKDSAAALRMGTPLVLLLLAALGCAYYM